MGRPVFLVQSLLWLGTSNLMMAKLWGHSQPQTACLSLTTWLHLPRRFRMENDQYCLLIFFGESRNDTVDQEHIQSALVEVLDFRDMSATMYRVQQAQTGFVSGHVACVLTIRDAVMRQV